jgi:hypothetical protein
MTPAPSSEREIGLDKYEVLDAVETATSTRIGSTTSGLLVSTALQPDL